MKKHMFILGTALVTIASCASSARDDVVQSLVETQEPTLEVIEEQSTSTIVPTNTFPPPIASTTSQLLPTAIFTPLLEPTATTVEVAPTAVQPTEELAETSSIDVIYGRTPEGAFFYGSPSAEITLIDYSEFL